jgi:hypothetical protein
MARLEVNAGRTTPKSKFSLYFVVPGVGGNRDGFTWKMLPTLGPAGIARKYRKHSQDLLSNEIT